MERLLLIGNEELDIEFFKLKTYSGDIKSYVMSEREVFIRHEDEVLKVESVNNMINEYDDSERKIISYDVTKILMLTFSDKELVHKVLSDESLPKGLFIDDLTNIMKLEEYLENN